MAEYDYIIRNDIIEPIVFTDNALVLVAGAVKVFSTIRGRNITFEMAEGFNAESEIGRNYMFFAPGSTAVMRGQTRFIGSGATGNNGEVIFAGNSANISFEGIDALSANVNAPAPYYSFENLELSNLGSQELDLNGLTLLGLKLGQFNTKILTVGSSGDDVIELFASSIETEELNTASGGDDNIDLDDGSTLVIRKSLTLVQVGNNSFELTNKSKVLIPKGCLVTLACNPAEPGREVVVIGDENLQKVNTGTTPITFTVSVDSELRSNDF